MVSWLFILLSVWNSSLSWPRPPHKGIMWFLYSTNRWRSCRTWCHHLSTKIRKRSYYSKYLHATQSAVHSCSYSLLETPVNSNRHFCDDFLVLVKTISTERRNAQIDRRDNDDDDKKKALARDANYFLARCGRVRDFVFKDSAKRRRVPTGRGAIFCCCCWSSFRKVPSGHGRRFDDANALETWSGHLVVATIARRRRVPRFEPRPTSSTW